MRPIPIVHTMKTIAFIAIACASCTFAKAAPQLAAVQQEAIPNPKINAVAHREAVRDSMLLREKRRVTEETFLELAAQADTVILDARSESKFKMRHIKGAVNLPFTEFTAENLARVIPTKSTRVLIYCNNNFNGDKIAFASKAEPAALNLSTFSNLVIYGYSNVYELGPAIDVNKARVPFEGTSVESK